jgi:hypothetical protein
VQDTDLQGTDKVIGTDATGQKTRNFSLSSIGKYLNKSGQLAVARQLVYNFQEDVSTARVRGSVSFENGGTGTFAATTVLIFHKLNASSIATDQLLSYGSGKSVVIFNPYVLNDFAEYKVLSAVEWDQDSSFMKLTLQYVEGSGTWYDGETFGFAFFKDAVDSHFAHNQTTAAATWAITHGLEKHPSVTAVDSAGTKVIGEVDYVDTNNLTIRFKYPFKGKAFLN